MSDVSESVGGAGGSECSGLRKESEKILRYSKLNKRLKWLIG